MSGASMGRRRRRVYERKFDWAEARRRYAAGESGTALAKEYGVNKEAVYRVLKMPAHLIETATQEQVDNLVDQTYYKREPCPRCERPKTYGAALCRDCYSETRELQEVTLEKVPGARSIILAAVPRHRIVQVGERFGVVVRQIPSARRTLIDFWDSGCERISNLEVVCMEPGLRVLVGGVEEQPEEIAA